MTSVFFGQTLYHIILFFLFVTFWSFLITAAGRDDSDRGPRIKELGLPVNNVLQRGPSSSFPISSLPGLITSSSAYSSLETLALQTPDATDLQATDSSSTANVDSSSPVPAAPASDCSDLYDALIQGNCMFAAEYQIPAPQCKIGQPEIDQESSFEEYMDFNRLVIVAVPGQ